MSALSHEQPVKRKSRVKRSFRHLQQGGASICVWMDIIMKASWPQAVKAFRRAKHKRISEAMAWTCSQQGGHSACQMRCSPGAAANKSDANQLDGKPSSRQGYF